MDEGWSFCEHQGRTGEPIAEEDLSGNGPLGGNCKILRICQFLKVLFLLLSTFLFSPSDPPLSSIQQSLFLDI